jgi:hypothetical protein
MNPKRLSRPPAYLWARCEGWAKIGVFQSEREIGDWRLGIPVQRFGRKCRLAWAEPGKEEGMRLWRRGLQPLSLARLFSGHGKRKGLQTPSPYCLRAYAQRLGEKMMGSRKTKPPETGDTQGEFFDENPGK